MDKYTATERAYKNGYARGYEDGRKDSAIKVYSIILDTEKMEAKMDYMINGAYYSTLIPWSYGEWD